MSVPAAFQDFNIRIGSIIFRFLRIFPRQNDIRVIRIGWFLPVLKPKSRKLVCLFAFRGSLGIPVAGSLLF